jgi:hypothetical protein
LNVGLNQLCAVEAGPVYPCLRILENQSNYWFSCSSIVSLAPRLPIAPHNP